MFVIGLSTEEPAFKRTTTWKALVAAKAWVSHYPKLEIICNQVSLLSIQGVARGLDTVVAFFAKRKSGKNNSNLLYGERGVS